MTVVTTVAPENRMTTHAIFFLIYGYPMLGTIFKKKLSFKDDNDDDDDAKVRAVLPGAKEWRAKKEYERPFSCVCHHHLDSWNLLSVCGALSRCRNPSKLSVSWAVGTRSEYSSGEMQM